MFSLKNSITIIGRLGRDPEVFKKEGSRTCVKFSVATDDGYRDKQSGEYVERTDWHKIYAFGPFADLLFEKLRSGDLVAIQGKLKYNKYTGVDGTEKTEAYILADQYVLFPRKQKTEEPGIPPPTPSAKVKAPPVNSSNSDDSADDELPF